jgi:hypothetical protein
MKEASKTSIPALPVFPLPSIRGGGKKRENMGFLQIPENGKTGKNGKVSTAFHWSNKRWG